MVAVDFGPSSSPSGLTPKSKLLRNPESQYGFVPKHRHHGGNELPLKDCPRAPHLEKLPLKYKQCA